LAGCPPAADGVHQGHTLGECGDVQLGEQRRAVHLPFAIQAIHFDGVAHAFGQQAHAERVEKRDAVAGVDDQRALLAVELLSQGAAGFGQQRNVAHDAPPNCGAQLLVAQLEAGGDDIGEGDGLLDCHVNSYKD
jgi:hypothetical protein